MANKSKKAADPTTVESASQTAKHNPFGNTGIRLYGTLLAFVGLLLCIVRNAWTGLTVVVLGIALVLGGFFVASTNIRNMISTKTSGQLLLYTFLGFVAIALGILMLIYRGQISSWFVIILGSLIGAFALALLIKFLVNKRSKRMFVFDIVMSSLAIVAGVLIALLYVPEVASAWDGNLYYVFGAYACAVGAVDMIMY
jgi:hypothetical protein